MNRDVCEHFNPVNLPCGKCKPEALRLADQLETQWGDDCELDKAAAELRRLHAELDRCKTTCDATAECWRLDAEQWKAQRDALLEALKEIQDWTARATARAAIAKCEECAKVCDELIADTPDNDPDKDAIGACADAIRARGQQ